MADPVSFVASIITLIGTINTASQGVQKLLALRNASDRLLDVHNKVSFLNFDVTSIVC